MSKLLAMMMSKKYTRLEYIESTGTQYIDTGIRANQDTTIKIKGSTINSETQIYGGCSTSGYLWGIGQQSNGNYLFGQYYTQSGNNRILTDYAGNDGVVRTLELRKNEFYIDNTLIGTFTTKTFTTNTIKLFTLNPSSSISSIKMYFAQIKDENGNLVFDGVPVIRNSDNEIGMFDRVSGQFFTNAGTGKFRFPDEVGYTVIGTPTITGGVVSGLSGSDYLQLPKLSEFNDIELVFLLKSGWQKNVANLLFFCSGKYFITVEDNNQIQSSFLNSLTQQRVVLRTINSIGNVSDIFVKIHYSNNYQYIATSSDGSSWDILASSEESFIGASSNSLVLDLFHNSGGAYFRGSIDLNETYIKIDRKLWFNGQPA